MVNTTPQHTSTTVLREINLGAHYLFIMSDQSIRLIEASPGKLAALDALAPVYLALCQQYVTLFCTGEQPDKFHAPVFSTPLSERWHRVAFQQAACIAQSWRNNRADAYQDYLEELADYQEQRAEETLDTGMQEPEWREWDVPTLKETCIQ